MPRQAGAGPASQGHWALTDSRTTRSGGEDETCGQAAITPAAAWQPIIAAASPYQGVCALPADTQATMEKLDATQCLRLVSEGVIGRIAFVGRYDITVLRALPPSPAGAVEQHHKRGM